MFGCCCPCFSNSDWFCAKALCDAGNDNNSRHNDAVDNASSTTNIRNDQYAGKPGVIPFK